MPDKKEQSDILPDDDFVESDLDIDDSGESDEISSKIAKLKKELKSCKAEKQEYLTGWQRARADYANQKNEFERKKADITKFASEKVLLDLLPVLDSFQMAFADKEAWEKTPENWRQGIEYIHSQLEKTVRDHGIEKIEVLDQDFNPNNCEALEQIEVDKESEDGKILEVVKDGYALNGKIVRPAQVKVGYYKK